VNVTRPDGSSTATQYDATGKVSQEITTDVADAKSQVATVKHTHDSVGNETTTELPNGAKISTYFDVFGKPIRITDGRLDMVNGESERSTYMKYDELGHLLKKLSPVLVNNGRQYSDLRRPYVEYTYDNYGRLNETRTLVDGSPITPGNMVMPTGATTSVTTVNKYDVFDQPTEVFDAQGYITKFDYDQSGNVVTQVRQRWKGNEPDKGSIRPSDQPEFIGTHTAFNLAGQPVQQVDGRNNSRYMKYDVLGHLTQIKDERGVVVKVNQYTEDGLLSNVWEPKLDGSAAPTTADLSSFVLTEQYAYGGRVYPSTVKRALMNQAADVSPSSSTFTYDYAGRPLTTVLPKDQERADGYPQQGL